MKTCAFVFARGGSKGVLGKNIRTIAGSPLLAYSLEVAHKIEAVSDIFVSTDDSTIASLARNYGAVVIDRPVELAGDNSPEWQAWQHAVRWVQAHVGQFDVFLSLPATSPLRSVNDVTRCLDKLEEGYDFVVTMTETNRSPWFNMVKSDEAGRVCLLADGVQGITRRQDAPVAYDMCTVAYVSSPECILKNKGIWDGSVGGILIPPERALDIDTELDIELAEFFINRKLTVEE